jgi:hypothetical protein
VTTSSPAVLRIGWRRSWIAPHLRRRLLAGILAAAGVLLALSAVRQPAAKVPVAAAPVRTTSISGLATGLVAAPVRLADAGVAPLLHPGIWVDVLVAGSTSDTGAPAAAEATVVASDVQVLSVQQAAAGSASTSSTSGGTLVVLAVSRGDALALAGGEASGRLSVSLLGS